MAVRKAMSLICALLLTPTLQHRIKRANDPTPHQLEEITENAGDDDTQEIMMQMGNQDREELAEALVEEDAADEAAASLGDSFAGTGVPQDKSAKTVTDKGSEQKGKVNKGKGIDESKGDDKGKGKGKGKDVDKNSGKKGGKDKAQDANKGEENQLVKVEGNGQDAGTGKKTRLVKGEEGKILFNSKERPKRKFQFMFRFPVWGGKWWISRLAFLRGPFVGFIYQEVPTTKTLLIKSWNALEEFGDEAVIPRSCNYVGAKVGDKITFDVKEFAQEGEGKPRPMAKNVVIRERGHAVGEGVITGPPLEDVRSQVLYYISDENLRTDKFFQDVIAASEGGWISTDFFLLCKRLKQLGASTKSIIDSLRDVSGVEVRDEPGQEAVRRTSQHPALEAGAAAKLSAALTLRNAQTIAEHLAPTPMLVKRQYSPDMMKEMGDLPKMLGHNQEKLAQLAGPQAAMVATKRSAGNARRAGSKAMKDSKTEEQAKEGNAKGGKAKEGKDSKKEEKAKEGAKKAAINKAAAKKAAAEKPAAKKALDVAGQAAAEMPAAEKAAAFAEKSLQEQAKAGTAAAEPALGEKAAKEAAAAVGDTSDSGTSWGSWLSKVPSTAWNYLGGRASAANSAHEEKKAGEQESDNAQEQQHEMQQQREPIIE